MSQNRKKFLMLLIDLIINIPCYVLVNRYVANLGYSHQVVWTIDEQIPFIPFFSIFYALVYVFPVICFYICWPSYPLLKGAFKAFLAMGLTCLVCYVLYPVEFQLRPELVPPYGIFEQLVRFFYWADNPPYNCLPSLHVAGAFMSARMVWLYRREWAPWFFGIAVLIAMSTLLIRQHYVVDVFAGLGIYLLWGNIFMPKEATQTAIAQLRVDYDSAE